MKPHRNRNSFLYFIALLLSTGNHLLFAQIGVGAKPPKGAEVLFDGSKKMLLDKWEYWQGPRFKAEPPSSGRSRKTPSIKEPSSTPTIRQRRGGCTVRQTS